MFVINQDYPTEYVTYQPPYNELNENVKLTDATLQPAVVLTEKTMTARPAIVNIFDPATREQGKFINRDGTLHDSPSYAITDYLPVEPGSYLITPRNSSYNMSYVVCLYNANKEVITNFATVTEVVSNGRECWQIVIPDDHRITQARFTLVDPEVFMIILGTEYPTTYIKYNADVYFLNEKYSLNTKQQEQVIQIAGASALNGKTMACCGDSIMESRLTGEKSNGGAWPAMIGAEYNMSVNNIGRSGSRLSDSSEERTPIYEQLQSLGAGYDYLCFDGGVNDFASNVPLGVITSGYPGNLNDFDKTTILGGLEALCSILTYSHTTAKKLFVFNHRIYANDSTAAAGS